MSLLRFVVFVIVVVPLVTVQAVMGLMHLWWGWIVIGLIAATISLAVDELYKHLTRPAPPPVGEKTDADVGWENQMILKRALAMENRGDWDKAIALFEQVIARDTDAESVRTARSHLEAIQKRRASKEIAGELP
jgi:hypothetical protein